MKKILLILAFLISGIDASYGARGTVARGNSGGSSNTPPAASSAQQSSGTGATTTKSARAARQSSVKGPSSNTAGKPSTSNNGKKSVGARAASLSPAATSPKATKARAGTKQNVINSGTKVAGATQNTVVDEECWNKFSGCMDSFCMLDNATGGRCICSDKNAEYDSILAEIQELDNQSYQMATVGVERIEMGDDADAIMAKTKAITNSIEKDANKEKSKRKSLDLTAWNNTDNGLDFEEEVEDVFSLASDGVSVTNKKGDALYRASAKLCVAQIPECSSQNKMMELMYQQRIRSDCTAYENSLRQQRTQSAQKLASAQSAMREAALEQYRNANKYDLGQCTIEFKKCMQTTGGCGDDFTGCVTQQTTRETLQGGKMKMKKIKGASTTIEIAAWTYDALESKKPLCMTVTQQCVNVKDQVWDTFLREVAPQVKSAELMAESDLRMSCISTISDCFQKACKDNMDPNNPDGSYDMCLTRPDTLRSFCKVQIDPCEAAEPMIMDYVRARLASMRVDSCTKEFKDCLQSEDRCGPDYSQCVGLDTDTIVNLCPGEKLVGCQYEDSANKDKVVKSQDEIYAELERIAQGIFLDIDNNMLTECQKAADAAMIKVCGSTENCDDLVIDESAGTRSFKYQVCQFNGLQGDGKTSGVGSASNSTAGMPKWTGQCYDSLDAISQAQLQQEGEKGWAGKLSGLVYWGEIEYDVDNNRFTTEEEYLARLKSLHHTFDDDEKEVIHDRVFGTEIRALTRAVEQAVSAIESDPKVQYCMTGRNFQGMRDKDGKLKQLGTRRKADGTAEDGEARFPKLTDQIRRMIATSALKNARNNYMKKYDEEIERMMKDQVTAAQRIDAEAARAQAKETCAAWAENAVLPKTKAPKASNAGKWIAVGIIAAVSIVASIFTFGAAAAVGAAAIATIVGASVTVAAAGTAAGLAASAEPVGKAEVDQWNYKESVTTVFNSETGECFKTRITQNCKKIKKNYCKEWEDAVEETSSINLLSNED